MSAIVVNSFTIPNYNGGGSTANIRIYANKSFLTSDGVRIFKSKTGGSIWYKTVSCTVAGTVITVPQITIDSTTDSDNPDATYTALIFDSSGIQRDYVFKNWSVPTSLGTPISFAKLVAHNSAAVLNTPGLTYTQEQIIALLSGYMPSNVLLRSYLPAAVQVSNNVALADTAMAVTLESGGKYSFRAEIFISANSGGFQFFLNNTATVVAVDQTGVIRNGTLAIIAEPNSYLNSAYASALTGTIRVSLTGYLEVSTAGAVTLQVAQNSSNALATTFARGSNMIWTKLN